MYYVAHNRAAMQIVVFLALDIVSDLQLDAMKEFLIWYRMCCRTLRFSNDSLREMKQRSVRYDVP